jgi:hypothetical protein
MRPRSLRVLLPLALAACGDNLGPAEDPDVVDGPTCDEDDLPRTLAALPNLMGLEERSCGRLVLGTARCFELRFGQPIDHSRLHEAQFTQRLFLIHRGCDRATLVADWGYEGFGFFDDELSALYQTNALWIEHRYQGESVPATPEWDWRALTIANGAADMHRVIKTFRRYYDGRWVSTGASKGGITALYHKYIYGSDLDGTIPYVAPASRARVDPEYQAYLETRLPPPCGQELRDAQVAALTTRREMMLQRLAAHAPGQESLALEYMTAHLDWGFWQYFGVRFCNQVPTAATSDAAFFQFFASFSGLGFARTPSVSQEMRYGALSYEWLTEQGFALQINAQVLPLLQQPQSRLTMEDQFQLMFPGITLPDYDGSLTADTRTWVRNLAEDVLLIYGEYDPWSGGAMDAPARASSARFFAPGATHSARLAGLVPEDEAAAIEIVSRLLGHPPVARKQDARRAGDHLHALLADQHQRLRGLDLALRLRAHPAR